MKPLEDKYTTSAMMRLLNKRYGLNPLGLKTLLRIDTKMFNEYVRGKRKFSSVSGLIIVNAFPELAGRLETEVRSDNL